MTVCGSPFIDPLKGPAVHHTDVLLLTENTELVYFSYDDDDDEIPAEATLVHLVLTVCSILSHFSNNQ